MPGCKRQLTSRLVDDLPLSLPIAPLTVDLVAVPGFAILLPTPHQALVDGTPGRVILVLTLDLPFGAGQAVEIGFTAVLNHVGGGFLNLGHQVDTALRPQGDLALKARWMHISCVPAGRSFREGKLLAILVVIVVWHVAPPVATIKAVLPCRKKLPKLGLNG